jgi:uncharacterized SAM-binding protein YcdF (DUF218 family)
LDEAPYKLSGAVAKLASITFWSIGFFLDWQTLVSYWGKICYCTHHTFLLGFPTRWLSCPHQCAAKSALTNGSHRSARLLKHV